jgi:tetratricopeptide (TPR) repeat protein
MYKQLLTVSLFCLIMTGVAAAQSMLLDLPLRSQYAEVTQKIGVTTISVKYSRPLVNGRKIWDGLVPYGKVWRVGANTNTTISFSDPVTIDGKPLDRGTYGLHMIPNADEWIVIFSKNSTSWGSFTYNQAEDALRINVRPNASETHNALTFDFDELQPASAVVKMSWEKISVPITVTVDVHQAVRESLSKQLRTLARYTWISWNDAANYLLQEKIDLTDALAYADRSISNEDRFDNELTRSRVLTALDRPSEAAAAQQKALDLGTPSQLNDLARELMGSKHVDEAIAIFRDNAQRHPKLWFVHDGLARVYGSQGKFAEAKKELELAITTAPADEKNDLNAALKRLEAGQEINK